MLLKTTPFPRMYVSLYVSDTQNTVRFYSDFFNQEPVKVRPNYAGVACNSPCDSPFILPSLHNIFT